MIDVYIVIHRSTWEGYDVSVERFDSYKKVVERLTKLLHTSGQSVSDVFDFSEHNGVWPLAVVQKYFGAVAKDYNFVNELFVNKSNYVGHEKISVKAVDEGSARDAWLVFQFQKRLFKLKGTRNGNYVTWDKVSNLTEVEETVVTGPAVSVFNEK